MTEQVKADAERRKLRPRDRNLYPVKESVVELWNTLASSRIDRHKTDLEGRQLAELGGLATRLQEIGRSPIEATMLDSQLRPPGGLDQVSLAQEVGLLDVYEETVDEVRRYRVPDLYRLALGMTRKGQA